MDSPANGPNSGPTTIAPTIVICESVTTPIAASSVASTMKATKVQVSVESSPTRSVNSSQITRVGTLAGRFFLGLVDERAEGRIDRIERDKAAIDDRPTAGRAARRPPLRERGRQ